MKIITNNVPRPILYASELTKKDLYNLSMDEEERAEADENGETFFRYKKWTYRIGDFMKLDKGDPFEENWHGYHSDSFFSGILVRLSDCGESLTVGTYIS